METSAAPKRQPLKPIILTLAVGVLLLVSFRVGMYVGFRKAAYSFSWGDNYHKMFAGPRRGFFDDFQGKGFMDAHGIFGPVMKIEGDDIVIRDKDQTEKTVDVTSSTVIRRGPDTVPLSDITMNDDVVIIGEPNLLGRIDAKFIRVMTRQTSPPQQTQP